METTNKLILMALLAATFAACKKDDDAPTDDGHDHGTVSGNLSLEFRFMEGGNTWTLDSTLTDSLGHAVKVDVARFFVSGLHAEDDGGNLVGDWDDTYLLIEGTSPSQVFALGTIAGAHIHQFHFNLGLDSTTNHADPTLAEAPLNDATMHWNWLPTAGYKFVVLEGRVDDDGDGVVDAGDPEFMYHCATDALLTEGHAHQHFDVVSGGNAVGVALVDMGQVFAGIDVLATPDGMGGTPVNQRLMSNLAGAIDGEE